MFPRQWIRHPSANLHILDLNVSEALLREMIREQKVIVCGARGRYGSESAKFDFNPRLDLLGEAPAH